MKIRQKHLTVRKYLFLLALVFACLFAFTATTKTAHAKSKVYKIKSASDWKNISKKNGGTFKLTKNIYLKNTKQYLKITKNKKYTIDFNGHKIVDSGTGSDYSPLVINKGTVVLKNSKKKGGVLYSKEWMAVQVNNKAKLYLKSGAIVNDTTEFRTGLASGVYLTGKAKFYLQGKGIVRSVNNGVALMGHSAFYMTGKTQIRAGVLNDGGLMFTHYGSGVCIVESGCKVSLKGGSIGTMSTPDTVVNGLTFTGSGSYPVLDREGKSLKLASGYKYLDYKGNKLSITGSNVDALYQRITGSTGSSGMPGEKKITTTVKDPSGYYTVFIKKK
ncbi:MAG: hypothetical protein IJ860_08460 [Eubacterium sp.]|nr:hypothetical protein [Eubacterium sp.]